VVVLRTKLTDSREQQIPWSVLCLRLGCTLKDGLLVTADDVYDFRGIS